MLINAFFNKKDSVENLSISEDVSILESFLDAGINYTLSTVKTSYLDAEKNLDGWSSAEEILKEKEKWINMFENRDTHDPSVEEISKLLSKKIDFTKNIVQSFFSEIKKLSGEKNSVTFDYE